MAIIRKYVLYIAWVQAWVAMLGSLFFSEVMKFTPCTLCWYQRICMYPLVLILGAGIYFKKKDAHIYALPLAIVGFFIALYHNLLYFNFIRENIALCAKGVSCTTKYFAIFGFITIPLLSFVAFSVIIACLLVYRKQNR